MPKKKSLDAEFLKNYEEARKTPKESPEYQEAVLFMTQWVQSHKVWKGSALDIVDWIFDHAKLEEVNPYLCCYAFNKDIAPLIDNKSVENNSIANEPSNSDSDTHEVAMSPKVKEIVENLYNECSKVPEDSELYKTTLALVHLWFDIEPWFGKDPKKFNEWGQTVCSIMKINFGFFFYVYSEELCKKEEEKKEKSK